MTGLRVRFGVPLLVLAVTACIPAGVPARAPVDPARGNWVLALTRHDGDVLQFALGGDLVEMPLADFKRDVESRLDGRLFWAIVSSDGCRVALRARVRDPSSAQPPANAQPIAAPGGGPRPDRPVARTHERSFVATTAGPPWNVVPIPDPAPRDAPTQDTVQQPLGWSRDGRRVAYRELVWDTARATWADDCCIAVLDAETERVERFSLADADFLRPPFGFAFSPDGASIAFTKRTGGIAAIDLASHAVADVPLPGSGRLELLDWLPDGRLAYQAADHVVLARRGDSHAVEFRAEASPGVPVSVRPDGGAVLCVRTRTSGFAAIPSLIVWYADGATEDLDHVDQLRGVYPEAVTWLVAPGLPRTAPR